MFGRSLLFAFCGSVLLHSAVARAESPCVRPEKHEHLTFLLVDRSDTKDTASTFPQTFDVLKQMMRPGERLVAAAITDKLSDTRLLLDVTKPKQTMWDSTLQIRQKEKAFSECLKSMRSSLEASAEQYKTSAILETISFAAKILTSDEVASKRLVIHSDMIQNSELLSLYQQKEIVGATLVERLKKDGTIERLKEVEVYVAGAGGSVTDKKSRAIEEFWRKYFESAGAVVKFYGPLLVGQS